MPSSVVALRADRPLTPAMVSAVWEIAEALDTARVPAEVPNAIWLKVPTARLRGEGARPDNVWLRECLDRLTGVKISGAVKDNPWGAVVVAEWHIEQGGTIARLLIPPAGIHALRAPANFTKIEAQAAHRLTGHGRRLYAILADKKRLTRRDWTFNVQELRALLGVEAQKSYDRWSDLRTRVLDPAVKAVNEYGTVNVKMKPIRQGRSIESIQFEWTWRDPIEAARMSTEGERHSRARKKDQPAADAPPMIEAGSPPKGAEDWWEGLSEGEREEWRDRIGRTFEVSGQTFPRRDQWVAVAAYAAATGLADQVSMG